MIHFRIKAALFVILFLSCIAVLDYPFLARIYNDRISGTVMEAYENRIGSLDDTGRRIQEAEAFNELLRDGFCSMADPVSFLSEAGSDPASVCRRLLCPDDSGTAGYIEIPSINLRLPLYPDVSDESLEKGACILPGSSLPVGGAGTHCCISGHSGLPERTMFTNLDLIKKGDLIRLHVLGLSLAYEMVSSEVVLPTEVDSLAVLPEEDLLTLITCTPYGINSHRLYIHARRVKAEEDTAPLSYGRTDEAPVSWLKRNWWMIATAYLFILMVVLTDLYLGKHREEKSMD